MLKTGDKASKMCSYWPVTTPKMVYFTKTAWSNSKLIGKTTDPTQISVLLDLLFSDLTAAMQSNAVTQQQWSFPLSS